MRTRSFKPEYVTHSDDLERIVRDGIESRDNHYYFILNDWDKDSIRLHNHFSRMILGMDGDTILNVISIFDIPNVVQVIRSVLVDNKGAEFISDLDYMNKIPAMITIQGNFVRATDYPESFYRELGI